MYKPIFVIKPGVNIKIINNNNKTPLSSITRTKIKHFESEIKPVYT